MTRAGALRRKITIQKPSTSITRDATGGITESWVTHAADRWASVEQIGGKELFTAGQDLNKIDVRFRLRYTPGVKTNMRIVYNGENYNIERSVNIRERNKDLEILCTRITT